MEQPAITVSGLQKRYGDTAVLRGLTFSVSKGEIFALLGANGAGKTTTLECMEGLRKYDGGNIRIEGSIGVQLQSASLPGNVKALEAARLFAKWNGVPVSREDCRKFGVEEFGGKLYKELSTGQKRRLHLLLALTGGPDVVFLDEPTAGLDVEGRIAFHQEIRRLKSQGKTIVLASHDMAEVEELCDRIAILKEGGIAFLGTTQELTSVLKSRHRIHVRCSRPLPPENLGLCAPGGGEQGYQVFESEDLAGALNELSALARAEGISIMDLHTERANLEQRFLDISKGGIS